MNNPFWDYSIEQYARQGVPEACLLLQDKYGMDVNMLLYGAWLSSIGRCPDEGHIIGLAREIGQWRERVVQPVRRLRRDWKDFAPANQLRGKLQALELEAERVQQDLMLAYFRAQPCREAASVDMNGNLAAVARFTAKEGGDWTGDVARLCRLLTA